MYCYMYTKKWYIQELDHFMLLNRIFLNIKQQVDKIIRIINYRISRSLEITS